MGTTQPATPTDDAEHRRRLREILDDAGTVMMLTHATDRTLHGRPMAIARIDDEGTMYFATGIDTPKIAELHADPRVDIVFQGKARYAMASGRARVSRERALIDELWQESWKVWFPEGKADPEIAIVVLDPERGEYWDHSGLKGLSFLFRTAKAYVTGSEVEPTKDDHAKIRM